MWYFYAMIVILVLTLAWLARAREEFASEHARRLTLNSASQLSEDFVSGPQPTPPEIFKKLRGLIDRWDRPEVWEHTLFVHDKDPGQLARLHLASQKPSP